MKIIFGLGNPGTRYEHTRHNAGSIAIDAFLKGVQTISCESKFKGVVCEVHFHNTKTFFVKPKTYMNNSGEAVLEICKFYKIDIARDLLVIHDEIDLPLGEIRTTNSSRAAGHNGVQNIIDILGSQDFHRIRIGVEGRANKDQFPTHEYVLQPFSEAEFTLLKQTVLPKVSTAITDFISKVE